MNGLRKFLLVLLCIVLLGSLAYALDCETASRMDGSTKPVYECLFDKPGGVALVGAGREVLAYEEHSFSDGEVSVVRRAELVQRGAIGWTVQNTASLQRELVVSYSVSNKGSEAARDVSIEQDVPGHATYKLRLGALAAGKEATASFSIGGGGGSVEMPAPAVGYSLQGVSLKASNATVDKMLDLWLSAGSRPLAGEDFEVTSPSGYRLMLRTDEYGKASFKPREVGAYLLDVPHREFEKPNYIYAVQEHAPPSGPEGQGALAGATAFLLAGVGGVRSIFGLLGPVGTGAAILAIVLAGWVFYRMRRPAAGEAVVAGEVPAELARYRQDEGQYSGLPPEATQSNVPLALSDEEKLKIMESAIELSPREKGIHSREARKVLKGVKVPRRAGRKGR